MLDSLSSLLRQMDLAERMYMQDSKTSFVYLPNTDIVEGKDEWIIISEIPGVKKEDISISFNMSDRKNANALMAHMFRHDIARIFKIGFHQIIHEKILTSLILITYKFFKLLS
jgi:hypothetical protein